uniref:Cholecystokinin B receptor n=1 Tax=Molossus molossus TaxID=27622 RepID=A0A7J8B801_MOLMO|nr:cholecystokinin B receptor [Molossus molossus]
MELLKLNHSMPGSGPGPGASLCRPGAPLLNSSGPGNLSCEPPSIRGNGTRGVSVSVSTLSLVAIALERYSAICRPLQARVWQTRSHAARVILATWMLSGLLMVPYPVYTVVQPVGPRVLQCVHRWPSARVRQTWSVLLLLLLFFIPACTGAVCADGTHSRASIRPPAHPSQAAGEEARGADVAGDRCAFLPVLVASVQRQHVEGLRWPWSAPSTFRRAHLFHPLAELRLRLCQPPGLLFHAPSLSPGLSRHVCPLLPPASKSSPQASSRRGPSHPLHCFTVQAELHHHQHAGAWLRGGVRMGSKVAQTDFYKH